MPEHLKTEENHISGCTASLWLAAHEGELFSDSDSVIVRGIAYSVITHPDPLNGEFEFSKYLSISRRNGLSKLLARLHEITKITEEE